MSKCGGPHALAYGGQQATSQLDCGSNLPFTGPLGVDWLLIAAVTLIAAGAVLYRRQERQR